MMLGEIEVTVLSDGTVDLEVTKLLTNTTPAKVKAALARVFLKDPVETSVNAFLVNTGEKLVLIGLVSGDKVAFPNAIVRADRRESDFWPSQANLDKAPASDKAFFQVVMAALKPYVAAERFKPFDGATTLVPGVRSVAARGHTPGHIEAPARDARAQPNFSLLSRPAAIAR